MKTTLLFLITSLVFFNQGSMVYAQNSQKENTQLIRVYWDNDGLNFRGAGTDQAYTNGLRLDYFYTKKEKSRFLLNKLMPKAGENSKDIYGWGITQLMYTPKNIKATEYLEDDYHYAGVLYATRSLYSYNPVKKYSFQTDLMVGVRGPASLAEETQSAVHGIIDYQKPMGWDNQLDTKVIVSVDVTYEKQIYSYRQFVELIGGGEITAGNFINSAKVFTLIRFGKINPYFDGLINQYSRTNKQKKAVNLHFIVKPEVMFVAHNSLLEDSGRSSQHDLKKYAVSLTSGVVLNVNRFSIAFNQNWISPLLEDLYKQEVGNLTLYFNW